MSALAHAQSTKELMTRAADFDRLYREHGPLVFRLLRRTGVAESDLEDAAQEVFVRAFRSFATFEGRSSVRTWICGIGVRVALQYRQRSARSKELLVERDEPSADQNPEDALERAQELLTVDRILEELDHEKRAVFVLFEVEGLSMAEVAEAVGCPLKTAYSRLYAAQKLVQSAVQRWRLRTGGR